MAITASSSTEKSPTAWRWLAGVAVVALVAFVWTVLCTVPGIYWNPPRIAAAFALAQGHSLYPLPTAGAQLGWFYPPGFAIWYLPVTWLHNPTLILLAAALINFATTIVPLGFALRIAGLSWAATTAGAFTGLCLLAAHRVTAQGFFWLHVDTVCVAAGIVGCAAVWRAASLPASSRWLHAAALATVAAVFTKQIAIVLPLVLASWLTIKARQPRTALLFCLWGGLYGVGALALCIARWGFAGIYSSLYLIHARTPYWGGSDMLVFALGQLAGGFVLWLGLFAILRWARRPIAQRISSRTTLGSVLGWTAMAFVPFGITAPLKLGGGLNSMHSLAYVVACLAVMTGEYWDATIATDRRARSRTLLAATWVVAAVLAHLHAREYASVWKLHRGQEQTLAQARQYRGKIYFPWNPLITLLSEDRLLPFDNALFCLDAAGMPVPREAVRAAIPRGALLVFPEPSQSQFVLTYLWPTPPAPTK